MKIIDDAAKNHPVLFALLVTVAWFVSLGIFMGIASIALQKPFGHVTTGMAGRLTVTACVLLLIWRLGWLKASGVARLGRRQVWLFALAGMIYFACAGLYSYFGSIDFDFSSLIQLSASRSAIISHFMAGLSEEILFRGLVLFTLIRVWGKTTRGIIGSVILASLLFAVLHLTQVFSHGTSLAPALLLTLETCIISIWWGALVVVGESIWPAVTLHCAVNAAVAVKGLTLPMIQPEILAQGRFLGFSIPLGILGIGLLIRHGRYRIQPGHRAEERGVAC